MQILFLVFSNLFIFTQNFFLPSISCAHALMMAVALWEFKFSSRSRSQIEANSPYNSIEDLADDLRGLYKIFEGHFWRLLLFPRFAFAHFFASGNISLCFLRVSRFGSEHGWSIKRATYWQSRRHPSRHPSTTVLFMPLENRIWTWDVSTGFRRTSWPGKIAENDLTLPSSLLVAHTMRQCSCKFGESAS